MSDKIDLAALEAVRVRIQDIRPHGEMRGDTRSDVAWEWLRRIRAIDPTQIKEGE